MEILWRLSRALYQMASKPDISGNNKKQLANDAFKTISEAMKINDNHFAVHKWMSVILDLKAACDGTTERVKNLEVVKNHMLVRLIFLWIFLKSVILRIGLFFTTEKPWNNSTALRDLFHLKLFTESRRN